MIASNRFEQGAKLIQANVDEAAKEDSTWTWRVDGYVEATQRLFSGSLTDTVIGPPIGDVGLADRAGYASVTIHDRYISVMVSYGLTGLVFLLIWLAMSGARIQQMDRGTTYPDRRILFNKVILEALLVSVVIYFVPYSGELLEGLLLGAMWLASAPQRVEGRRVYMDPAFAPRQLVASTS